MSLDEDKAGETLVNDPIESFAISAGEIMPTLQ
jgi:hypothetical protein